MLAPIRCLHYLAAACTYLADTTLVACTAVVEVAAVCTLAQADPTEVARAQELAGRTVAAWVADT